jgi:hypothetical protein
MLQKITRGNIFHEQVFTVFSNRFSSIVSFLAVNHKCHVSTSEEHEQQDTAQLPKCAHNMTLKACMFIS